MMKETFYMSVGELKPNPEKVARLLAVLIERGFKNKDIAERCGASPSDVSNWKGVVENKENSYLPRKDQYEIMVSMYEHKIPGDSFQHRKVFKSIEVQLPDDWEQQMIAWFVNKQTRRGWGYQPDSFEEIENKHFEMLLKSETKDLGVSYEALSSFQEELGKILSEYDATVEEAKRIQQEEEAAYQKELEEFHKEYPPEALSEDALKKLYKQFNVVKAGYGEQLKGTADRHVMQAIRKGIGLAPDFKKRIATEESGSLVIDDLKKVANELLVEISSRCTARKAADDARHELYKLVGNYDSNKLAELEGEYLDVDIVIIELIENADIFPKEQINVFTKQDKSVEVPLRTTLKDWLDQLNYDEYLTLKLDEVNISGRLIYESKSHDTKYEVFSLYSNRLLVLKTIDWNGQQITIMPDVLTVQDVVGILAGNADDTFLTYDAEGEQIVHKGLKEALLFNGYNYPGVRSIL